MLKKLLNDYKKVSFSAHDLLKLVNYEANLIKYSQLKKYKTIDEALGPHGSLILLYETKQNYGHWCCVIKRPHGVIEHFDSYGYKPDETLKYNNKQMRKYLNQDYPLLSYLLLKSPYEITYNEFRLQKKKKDINTCGRWVGCRILLKKYSIYEFIEFFKDDVLDPDDIVTLITILY